jgi:hypothetical protein
MFQHLLQPHPITIQQAIVVLVQTHQLKVWQHLGHLKILKKRL